MLEPTCHADPTAADAADAAVAQYTPFLSKLRARYGIKTSYNPCISSWTPTYMNRPDVIKAIHADKHKDPARRWPDHPKNWG